MPRTTIRTVTLLILLTMAAWLRFGDGQGTQPSSVDLLLPSEPLSRQAKFDRLRAQREEEIDLARRYIRANTADRRDPGVKEKLESAAEFLASIRAEEAAPEMLDLIDFRWITGVNKVTTKPEDPEMIQYICHLGKGASLGALDCLAKDNPPRMPLCTSV